MLRFCSLSLVLFVGCGRSSLLEVPGAEVVDPPVSRQWRSLSIGYERGCGVDPRGTLWCWPTAGAGVGLFGGRPAGEPFTGARVDGSEWSVVSVGPFLMCALKTDGSLWCQGRNASGILGPTLSEDAPLTHVADGYVELATGSGYACALRDDGSMDCFGHADFHENLTLWTPVDRTVPRRVPGHFRALASSWYETAALSLDGELFVSENDDVFARWAPEQRFRELALGWGPVVAMTTEGVLQRLDGPSRAVELPGRGPFAANDAPVFAIDDGLLVQGWLGGKLPMSADELRSLVRLGASHDGVCFERSIGAEQDDVIECAFEGRNGFERRALTFQ